MQNTKLIRAYLDTFFNIELIPENLKVFLTDDFEFVGPLMEANGPDEFIKKLKGFGERIVLKSHVFQIIEQDNTVVARYDFILNTGKKVPACEWYEIKNGKIFRMYLHCDARLFIK